MSTALKLTGLLVAGVLCVPAVGRADTQNAPTTHRIHSKKKAVVPPPLPSGTQGPVPQVPLDAIPAVAPDVSYQDGLLTIVAPNSTLGDILRGVRKHTSAEIDIPATATERVVTRLGPAPAREVMAELLNGSRFNYILLGSPEDANALVRVVLVAKTPDTPTPAEAAAAANGAPSPAANPADAAAAEAEAADDSAADDSADQSPAEAEQTQPGDQPGVKTPQQLLQEMQQRQLQMQQQQQAGQQAGQPAVPTPPGAPAPHQPQPAPDQQ